MNYSPSSSNSNAAAVSIAAAAVAAAINYIQPNEWTCPICLEGPKNQEPTIIHPCGKHIYHLMCYVMDTRSGNKKCGMCRGGTEASPANFSHAISLMQQQPYSRRPPPPLIRSGNVLPKLLTPISDVVNTCVYCLADIEEWKKFVELIPCYHKMHSDCTIQVMLGHGVTQDGQLFCRGCHQHHQQ
jgi:hypothetical protein